MTKDTRPKLKMKSIDTIVPRMYFLATYSDEPGKASGSWLMSDFKMELV